MKFAFPNDIYRLIGSLAGDVAHRLGFTLTPARKELSSKIYIVDRKSHKGWLLNKFSWLPVDVEDIMWDNLKIDLRPLYDGAKGTYFEKDAEDLLQFCRRIIDYTLEPHGRPKYNLWL